MSSVRNKYEMLSSMIWGKTDILLISETKLDSSFPSSQFVMDDSNIYIYYTEMIKEVNEILFFI